MGIYIMNVNLIQKSSFFLLQTSKNTYIPVKIISKSLSPPSLLLKSITQSLFQISSTLHLFHYINISTAPKIRSKLIKNSKVLAWDAKTSQFRIAKFIAFEGEEFIDVSFKGKSQLIRDKVNFDGEVYSGVLYKKKVIGADEGKIDEENGNDGEIDVRVEVE